ncbi:MAG: bifunctional DNA-binding transcriptional regulator/O6-methylguanine-DNA methyltransferase Ada [Chitinophagales bacterium]|nr:bifunctional DNA-binding transcriptional regulator/O6-methylguanine-DNA methyltransferase Ada [Hyphomicrobiales bacterium]
MDASIDLDDDVCWEAIRNRDARFDGQFYTAVATTGIYCRPNCSARQPLRKNIRFFRTREEAETAGFRACKRCKPNEAPALQRQREIIVLACRHIEGAEDGVSLRALSAQSGLSPHHFHRLFKQITGVTPKAYAASARTKRMGEQLTAQPTITKAIYCAGYSSSSRFYEAADATLGMTPTNYRNGGMGQTIEYAVTDGPCGMTLIARTPRGICSIMLGDEAETLATELKERFPRAAFRQSGEMKEWAARAISQMHNPVEAAALPLDIQGTAFQRLVWQALREIPAGETESYKAVAARLGRPKAVRAVAKACAENHVAVLIPCHRVVGAKGALTGYRWGIERKRALLALERDKGKR